MALQFKGKYVLKGTIKCVTGLHIGGTTTGVEIGGVDNTVIKDPITSEPIMPGSSLKGKMRAMTEWLLGLIQASRGSYGAYPGEELKTALPPNSTIAEQTKRSDVFKLSRLYGLNTNDPDARLVAGPSRLIVRDARLTSQSKNELTTNMGDGIFTEVKTENALDRITAEANPRPVERVPAGSIFDFEMIIDMYADSAPENAPAYDDRELLPLLFSGMTLVEQSALGGAGSRGSGQVRFEGLSLEWRPASYYRSGQGTQPVKLASNKVSELMTLDISQLPI